MPERIAGKCWPAQCPGVWLADEGDVLVVGYSASFEASVRGIPMADDEWVVRISEDLILQAAEAIRAKRETPPT